jgi:hypothetical protein
LAISASFTRSLRSAVQAAALRDFSLLNIQTAAVWLLTNVNAPNSTVDDTRVSILYSMDKNSAGEILIARVFGEAAGCQILVTHLIGRS